MIDLHTGMAAVGLAAGVTASILGVAQLTCEHANSPWAQRVSTVLLVLVAAFTAIDCWDFWAGVDPTLDVKAVAFCIALILSWGYRRVFGFTSQRRVRPPG